MPRVLIAASGTGGHIFPALAVAEALSESWEVSWLGVPDRLENQLLPTHFDLITIPVGGLQGNCWQKILTLIKLLASVATVHSLLQRKKINAVFTTGGYIAAPAILGAYWNRLPVVLHESNAIPGRVSRLLGRFCQVVALGQPISAHSIPNCQTVITGTPLRSTFFKKHNLPTWVPNGNGPLLVVIGGSQGAIGLNRMIEPLLPALLQTGCRVVYLKGIHDQDHTIITHPNLVVKAFSNEIPALLQYADLAISRAGAGTLSELAASGTPSILVPFPQATDHHQEANAAYVAAFGAAVVVHQHAPEDHTLKETIWRLLIPQLQDHRTGKDHLAEMSKNMKKLSPIKANQKLVKLIEELTQ